LRTVADGQKRPRRVMRFETSSPRGCLKSRTWTFSCFDSTDALARLRGCTGSGKKRPMRPHCSWGHGNESQQRRPSIQMAFVLIDRCRPLVELLRGGGPVGQVCEPRLFFIRSRRTLRVPLPPKVFGQLRGRLMEPNRGTALLWSRGVPNSCGPHAPARGELLEADLLLGQERTTTADGRT
jgi:hypothetical protein